MAQPSTPINGLLIAGLVATVKNHPDPVPGAVLSTPSALAKNALNDLPAGSADPKANLQGKNIVLVVMPKDQAPLSVQEDGGQKKNHTGGSGTDTHADANPDDHHEEEAAAPTSPSVQTAAPAHAVPQSAAAHSQSAAILPVQTVLPVAPSIAASGLPIAPTSVESASLSSALPIAASAAAPSSNGLVNPEQPSQAGSSWGLGFMASAVSSCWSTAWNYGKQISTKIGAAAVMETVKTVAAYESVAVQREKRHHLPQVRKELETLTGSLHLEKAVTSFTSKLSDWIQKSFINNPFEKDLTGLQPIKMLRNTKSSNPFDIKQIIDGTALIATRNLASHASFHKDHKADKQHPHNIFLDMLTEVLQVVHEEVPNFEENLSKVEGIIKTQDPKLRIANLQTILKPAAEKFLAMAFPNKQDDIYADFPLNVIIWECLKEILLGHPNGSADIQIALTGIGWADATLAAGIWQIVQQVCTTENVDHFYKMVLDSYHDAKAPLDQAQKDRLELQKMPGGQNLLKMLDTFAQKSAPIVKGVMIEEKSSDLAKKAMAAEDKSGKKIIQVPEVLEGWLQSWLQNRIKELGQSQDKDVVATWQFIWKYVEAGAIHMVSSLVKNPDGSFIQGDIPTTVLSRLLGIAINALKGNEEAFKAKWHEMRTIESQIAELKKLEDDLGQKKIAELTAQKEMKEKEMEALFKPVAEEFLKQVNLDKDEKLPVPGPLKTIVGPLLRKIAPALCKELYADAHIYLEMIKPEALKAAKLDKLENTESVSAAVLVLMEVAEPKLKAALASKSKDISNKAVDAIADSCIEALCGNNLHMKDKIQSAVPNLGLSDNEKELLSELIKNLALTGDDAIQEAWKFANGQAHDAIVKVLNHLALSNPVLKDYTELTDKREVLSTALLHIMGIGAKHFAGMREKVQQKLEPVNKIKAEIENVKGDDEASKIKLKALHEALQKHEEELTALFLPISQELASAAGINGNKLQKSLVEKILPGVIRDMFVDLVISKPMPEALKQKLKTLDKTNKLPELCCAISEKITNKLQEIFKDKGPQIAKLLNAELLEKGLSPIDEIWLGKEINTIGADKGPTAQKGWGFIQEYSQKLLEHVFAHLALSYEDGAAPAEANDVMSNCFKQLLKIVHQHSLASQGDQSMYEKISKGLAEWEKLPAGEPKDKKRQELQALVKPAVLDLLKAAGLGSAAELPVPTGIRSVLWDSLSGSVLPELVLNVMADFQPKETLAPAEKAKVQKFKGYAQLQEAIDVMSKNIVPELFGWLGQNGKKVAAQLKETLAEGGFDMVEKAWLENTLKHISESGNPAVKGAWSYIEKLLAGNAFKAAQHVALADPAGDQGAMLYENILTKIVLNALKVARKHVKDKHDIIEAAIQEFDQLSLMNGALGAAKKHLKAHQATIQAKLAEIKGGAAPVAGKNAAAEILLNKETQAILKTVELDEAGAAKLAKAGRQFLMKTGHHHLQNDAEVLRTLFFGSLLTDFASHEAKDIEKDLQKAKETLNTRVQFSKTAEEAVLKQTFGEASAEVMKMTGLDKAEGLGIPGAGTLFTLDTVRDNIIPRLLLNLYRDMTKPQGAHQAYMKRLNELLYDPVSLPKDMNQGNPREIITHAYKDINQLHSELWKKAGTAEVASNLNNMCKVFANDIKDVIKKFLQADSKQIADLISGIMPAVPLNQGGKDLVAEAIKDLAGSADPAVKGSFEYVQSVVHAAFLKALVHIGETTAPVMPVDLGQNPQKVLIANIMIRIFGTLAKHKDAINIKMADYRKLPNDEKLKKAKLQEIFKPVAKDLLNMTGLQMMADMPVPEAMKAKLWNSIQEEVLPDLLAKMFLEATAWEIQKDKNKEKLRFTFGTTHPQEAVPVLAQFAAEATRQYLALDHAEVGSVVNDALKKYLTKSGTPEGLMAASYLGENKELAKFVLGQNIKNIATFDDPAMKWAWPAAKDYIDATMMKVFANFSGRVAKIEAGKSDFLVDTSVNMLKVMAQHFTRINQITQQTKVPHAFNVDPLHMLNGFQNPDANPKDKDSFNVVASKQFLEAKKAVRAAQITYDRERWADKKKAAKVKLDAAQAKLAQVRKELYFVPLAEKFLDMAGVKSAEDLPFPSPVKEQLWEICRTELVPAVLQNIYNSLMDKGTLNSILLNSIEALNDALDNADAAEPADTKDDPKQTELNKACGELVLELVKLVPQTLTKSVFKIDKVKTMTAEKIGKSIRANLGKWTMLKAIDEGLFKGMPNLTPGTWQGPIGQEQFVPKNPEFQLALTPEEKRKQVAAKQKEAAETQDKLKKTLTDTLSAQIKVVIRNFFSSQWENFQTTIDKEIAKHCGKLGLNVKKVLDGIFHKIFIDFMGMVFGILGWPFYKLFWLCMDIHLGLKANQIIENLHMEIHESVFYGMTNELFKSIKAHEA